MLQVFERTVKMMYKRAHAYKHAKKIKCTPLYLSQLRNTKILHLRIFIAQI